MAHQNTNKTLSKEQLHSREHFERLVMQKAIIKEITAVSKLEQAELHKTLANGDSHSVTNEFGAKIGSISRSMPKPAAVVEDKSVVLATFDRDDLEIYIPLESLSEAVDFLNQHAPHLLGVRPTEAALKKAEVEVVKNWQKTGQTPEGWGIQLKDGITTIRPNALAVEAAQERLYGITTTPEIEEGEK